MPKAVEGRGTPHPGPLPEEREILCHRKSSLKPSPSTTCCSSPRYSEVVPAEVDVGTRLTRNIRLNIPLLSSPMDTVTESEMAIALAQEGGLGVIHKNMSIERQTEEVDKVKRSANGIIVDPVTLPPDATRGTGARDDGSAQRLRRADHC